MLTLIVITRSQLARVDISRGRTKLVRLRDRIANQPIGTLVDAALRQGPKKAGDVWVMSTDFWSGVVHLGPDVARTLDEEELQQAIALEAETDSGISAFDSRLGTVSLPPDESGDQRLWVTQITQSDWQDAKHAVTQFGGKLAGMGSASLAHPPVTQQDNATAIPGTDSPQTPWRLLQAFGELTIGVRGLGSEIQDVITLGNLNTQRNQSQLQDWCTYSGHNTDSVTWVTDGELDDRCDTQSSMVLS
ncbi:MAG: hypothetical protein AAFP90_06330, partial [Planctomycetota bacterium]